MQASLSWTSLKFAANFYMQKIEDTTNVYFTKVLQVSKQPTEAFQKKVFLKTLQKSQENTCDRVCNFIKKKILTQVFSFGFWDVVKNIFFTEHLWTTASASFCYHLLLVKLITS